MTKSDLATIGTTAIVVGSRRLTIATIALGLFLACSAIGAEHARADEHDWPMWGYDAARSAATPVKFEQTPRLKWVRQLPAPRPAWGRQLDDRGKLEFDRSSYPVVRGERIFVPSSSTDSLTAYRTDNGQQVWRFYADGPVRLAPVAWEEYVYIVSDDGYLYCLDAESGEQVWKFRGGVSSLHLLGNERIINMWPARGGPVVADGTLYFAAGIWPMHGVFLYALDARTGEIEWLNDTTGSDYVDLPHGGASGYGSIAPQGYIAVADDRLVVSGGRTPPLHFSRETGEVVGSSNLRSRKGSGNYAVSAQGEGARVNDKLRKTVSAIAEQLDAPPFAQVAAHGKLFVTTDKGTLYCFASEAKAAEPIVYEYKPATIQPKSDAWAGRAETIVASLADRRGYALLLGAGSGDLLRELLARTELHIVVVESQAKQVLALRDEFAGGGVYGARVAVIEQPPAEFAVQPYLFSLIASEDAAAAEIDKDTKSLARILDRLRPYEGVAYLFTSTDKIDQFANSADGTKVDQVETERRDGYLFAARGGPLTGAGQWTHQYHDPANTTLSLDDRVRLPLGLLWFGGPNNHNILPRHAGGPKPQVVGGRQFHLGVETISARCVYTGRPLWEREFPGIGHPFTNLDLEKQWAGRKEVYMSNIPGATYIGSPLASASDGIYLRREGVVHRLDPKTGETVAKFKLPGEVESEKYGDEINDWGHISLQGDLLITTVEPHLFEDQKLGWTNSYSGTSSRRLVVLNRHDGSMLWQREAEVGFRHNTIISNGERLFVIDGLSAAAHEHLARRGEKPKQESRLLALDLKSGKPIWQTDREVFGTHLMYSAEHDVLIEGGSQDLRHRLGDEPRSIVARNGSNGEVRWSGGDFTLPGVLRGEMLIPGRAGQARNLLTGEPWQRDRPLLGECGRWGFGRAYGCNTLNASKYLLLFRSGSAACFDLEHDSGTANFGGFRSGCTANLIPADGVLNALDYTRTCTCSYQHQTSLALIHMPEASHIEAWTRNEGARPDPSGYGVNMGAPGRRVDRASGLTWHPLQGTRRRHPSWITESGDGVEWVGCSVYEGNIKIKMDDLLAEPYVVRLHFAELEEDVEQGSRLFDVFINGEPVLARFDVAKEAGGPRQVAVKQFEFESDGVIEVEVRKSDDSQHPPIISGIEVRTKQRDREELGDVSVPSKQAAR